PAEGWRADSGASAVGEAAESLSADFFLRERGRAPRPGAVGGGGLVSGGGGARGFGRLGGRGSGRIAVGRFFLARAGAAAALGLGGGCFIRRGGGVTGRGGGL